MSFATDLANKINELQYSTLPADEVAREKDVILREIAMTKDDADNRL